MQVKRGSRMKCRGNKRRKVIARALERDQYKCQAKANKRYYQNRRKRLLEKLGGVCVQCRREGRENSEDLEFDHKCSDRNWCMRKFGPFQRLKKIEQEAEQGRIQVLCGHHNGKKRNDFDDDLARELRGEDWTESESEPMAKTATEHVEKKKRNLKPRYGMAYKSFAELMAAPNGEGDTNVWVLPIILKADELCIRATSYAQALNAACLAVFGEPRKMTDKEQLEKLRRYVAAQADDNGLGQ